MKRLRIYAGEAWFALKLICGLAALGFWLTLKEAWRQAINGQS